MSGGQGFPTQMFQRGGFTPYMNPRPETGGLTPKDFSINPMQARPETGGLTPNSFAPFKSQPFTANEGMPFQVSQFQTGGLAPKEFAANAFQQAQPQAFQPQGTILGAGNDPYAAYRQAEMQATQNPQNTQDPQQKGIVVVERPKSGLLSAGGFGSGGPMNQNPYMSYFGRR
jgi:hypothetical protein